MSAPQQHQDALRAVVLRLLDLDVRGHTLADRLQFTPAGRAILEQARAALAEPARQEPLTAGVEAEAVALAKRMAKAAGPQRPDVMARAAYMLVCCAAMTKDAVGYMEWLDRREAAT